MATLLRDLRELSMTYLEATSIYVGKGRWPWLERGWIGPHVSERRYSAVA